MPYTIKRQPDLPVFVINYQGDVTLKDFQNVDYEIATLLATFNEDTLYIIENIREAKTSFVDIFSFFRQTHFINDPTATRVKRNSIFVGHNVMSSLMEQFGKTMGKIPHFANLEDALKYINYELDNV